MKSMWVRCGGVLAALALIAACDSGVQSNDAPPAATSFEDPDDRTLGVVGAPVVLVEYASTGCGACAAFHNGVFPALKEKYIEPGHVRFIFREMQTGDPVMFGTGALLARCVDEDKFFPVVEALFSQFAILAQARRTGEVREAYLRIARNANLSEAQFDACLSDQAAFDAINARSEKASSVHGVTGTPGFLVNGENLKTLRPELGGRTPVLTDFDAVFAPLLAEAGVILDADVDTDSETPPSD